MNHKQVMRRALEQLKINRTNFRKGPSKSICKMLAGGNDEVIADLESALAEPVQEPVAWSHINGTSDTKWHPPQRKPLTEEEIADAANSVKWSQQYHVDFARAIERAHGIGEY